MMEDIVYCKNLENTKKHKEETPPPHTHIIIRMTKMKKTDYTRVDKDTEELEFSYTAGWNVKWYNHLGK